MVNEQFHPTLSSTIPISSSVRSLRSYTSRSISRSITVLSLCNNHTANDIDSDRRREFSLLLMLVASMVVWLFLQPFALQSVTLLVGLFELYSIRQLPDSIRVPVVLGRTLTRLAGDVIRLLTDEISGEAETESLEEVSAAIDPLERSMAVFPLLNNHPLTTSGEGRLRV